MRASIFAFAVVLAGCAAPRVPDRLTALQLAAANEKIDLSDGVSEVEAYKIASQYKDRTSEGYVDVPKDEGQQWRVSIYETIIGIHARDVLIDKTTGACHVVGPVDAPEKVPNNAPVPTPGSVTPAANAPVAPPPGVAHLWRSPAKCPVSHMLKLS